MRISDWSSDVCSSDLGLRQYGHADVNRAGDDDDVRECDVRINNRLAQFVPVVLYIRCTEAAPAAGSLAQMAANTLDHLRRVDEEAGESLRMQPREVIPLAEGVGQQRGRAPGRAREWQ